MMDTESKGYEGTEDAETRAPKRLLTEKEAALRLGVSIDTVRRMRYSGILPYVPIGQTGRGIRYAPEHLDLWIERSTTRELQ